MALTEHYYTRFEESCFFHVYNRTVDRQPMFKNEDNYQFFLKQYDHYLSPVADTYAFCLLGNHFHLLIKIKDVVSIMETSIQNKQLQKNAAEKPIHDIVSHQFRKLFQSYAMAFNVQNDRTGTLFQTPFKRVKVNSDNYFTQLIYYIHSNPQKHGLTDDFRSWPWSTYKRFLNDKQTKLKKEEVLRWFGGAELYKKFHNENHSDRIIEQHLLDDDRD